MAYNAKLWKNRETEYPNRRLLAPTGTADVYDVSREEGLIMEAGDPFNADTMNDLENRIANGFTDVDTALANKAIFEWIYPVGSYYISAVATDPAELFGFGVWERAALGRMLVGVDEVQEAFAQGGMQGGEAEHTLTEAEMPRHRHSQWQKSGDLQVQSGSGSGVVYGGVTSNTGYAGEGAPHNNMPPYETAYFWRRME